MGWENRNGRRYYVETVYVDGVRTRTCHGYSLYAMDAADRVEKARRADAEDLALVRTYQLRDQKIDRKLADFEARARQSLRQQLVPHGYHWTNGQWRKLRSRRKRLMNENNTNLLLLQTQPQTGLHQPEESGQAAEHLGDEVRRLALEPLRDLKRKSEDGPRVEIRCSIDETVEEVKIKVAQLRQELQYEEANIFDRLLIEQLLSAWVQCYVASWLLNGELPVNRTWRENQYFERRYQHCHTRLAKAIDQLTKVRQIPVDCLHIETRAEKDAKVEGARKWQEDWDANYAAMEAEARKEEEED